MMKYAPLVWTGLGILLVVPSFSGNALEGAQGIEQAIAETVGVLSELRGLEQAIGKGDPRSLTRLLELTEPPLPDAQERDLMLNALRRSVSELQMRVDASQTETPHASPWPSGRSPGTAPLNLQALGRLPGESPLAGTNPPLLRTSHAPGAEHESTEGAVTQPVPSREPEGYSADSLRQARLLLLLDRPAEALELLQRGPGTSETDYWIARSLEKLGRLDEAIERYRAVSSAGDDPALAARAKQDLTFLEWKRDMRSADGGKK